MKKSYYIPAPEDFDCIFGPKDPVCIDQNELNRLCHEWAHYDENGPTPEDIAALFHVASATETEMYGVYDSYDGAPNDL